MPQLDWPCCGPGLVCAISVPLRKIELGNDRITITCSGKPYQSEYHLLRISDDLIKEAVRYHNK